MKRGDYPLLFVLGMSLVALTALFQHSPGYMDADYYYGGGMRLAQGYGFREVILWNYLDNPSRIPHASHAYWMPLASMIAALGMLITGSVDFWAARLGFIFLAGWIAPGTAALAFQLSRRREHAMLAGLLAAIPGFYLAYLPTVDIFGLLMVLGIAWFLLVGYLHTSSATHRKLKLALPLILGLIAGLFHLSRADGLMWLLVGMVGIAIPGKTAPAGEAMQASPTPRRYREVVVRMLAILLGYSLVMGSWLARNHSAFGTLLSPGGNLALWITDYDELFIYPPELLTPSRWLASGLGAIFQARWQALTQNLQTALAVQGEIFLLPLILLGLWNYRSDGRIRLGLFAWALVLGIMTVVFPYAGWRGGFFHSGAAFQPLFWAVAPAGLDVFVDWGRRVRRWNVRQASMVFRVGLLALAVMLTALAVQRRVVGADILSPSWDNGWESYRRLEGRLIEAGVDVGATVMVNNAPGYFAANQRPALSIPDGDLVTLLEVAHRYGAKTMLLEANHPEGLAELYRSPGDQGGLIYLFTYEGAHGFEITH